MDNEGYRRFLAAGDAERLVQALTEQQFLNPHQSVDEGIAAVVIQLGVCPGAARYAIETLRIDPLVSFGRLRRTELMQLGRTMHRLWRQSVVEESTPSQRG